MCPAHSACVTRDPLTILTHTQVRKRLDSHVQLQHNVFCAKISSHIGTENAGSTTASAML